MRAKKYGGISCLRNHIVRRNLFFNKHKGLSLDEIREYLNYKCIDKWWEVTKVSVSENTFSLVRQLILATPTYSVAWNTVKEEKR